MKNRVFITGSSLICSLGKSKSKILKKIKNLDSSNYEIEVKKEFAKGSLYKIKNFSKNPTERFYQILAKSVKKALKDAKLDKHEQEELVIFIGSTSMKISTDEDKLTHLGYEIIGQKIQEQVGSKEDFYIFSTACTSSANAFNYAANMIKHKEIKRALVLGFEFFNKTTYNGFDSFLLLSHSNIYRPFDKKGDGIVLGEGCSAMVLESKKRDRNDFEYISSSNICDTYSETANNENGKSIEKCLKTALKDSNLSLHDIDLIKAHTAGSENSNLAESRGLEHFLQNKNIPITSLKPFIGHTLGASGTNEMVLLLMCIKDGFIPSMRGFDGNEDIRLDILKKPMNVNEKLNILFNFIGFSGNNTSIILGNK